MLFVTSLLSAILLLAFNTDNATARPSQVMDVAAVSPPPEKIIDRYQVGKVAITVATADTGAVVQKRDVNSTSHNPSGRVVDLTPADPTRDLCYPGGFQVPAAEDCQVVVDAQLYNSTGSLVAYPGTIVYVSYQTCAVVLQNLDQAAPEVQYNWAMLGKAARSIFNSCLVSKPFNMGGALFFENYLNMKFNGLYITLQRFDDSQLEAPKPLTDKPKPIGAK